MKLKLFLNQIADAEITQGGNLNLKMKQDMDMGLIWDFYIKADILLQEQQ